MYEIVIVFKPPFINSTYSRSGCQHRWSSCLKTAWCSGCDGTSCHESVTKFHSLGSALSPLIDTWTVCVIMICTESDVTVVFIHLPVNSSCFWGKVIERLLPTIMKHELIYWVNLHKLFLENNQPLSLVLFIYLS